MYALKEVAGTRFIRPITNDSHFLESRAGEIQDSKFKIRIHWLFACFFSPSELNTDYLVIWGDMFTKAFVFPSGFFVIRWTTARASPLIWVYFLLQTAENNHWYGNLPHQLADLHQKQQDSTSDGQTHTHTLTWIVTWYWLTLAL